MECTAFERGVFQYMVLFWLRPFSNSTITKEPVVNSPWIAALLPLLLLGRILPKMPDPVDLHSVETSASARVTMDVLLQPPWYARNLGPRCQQQRLPTGGCRVLKADDQLSAGISLIESGSLAASGTSTWMISSWK